MQEKLRIYLSEDNQIPNTEKELRDSINSPQFLQLINAFRFIIIPFHPLIFIFSFHSSFALQSGELGAILTRLDFPDDVTKAANEGDIQSFAQALTNYYKSSREDSSDPAMDIDE